MITNMLFAYNLDVDIPGKVVPPDLSLCFRYIDIFNTTRYAIDKNIQLKNTKSPEDIRLAQATVTIADIFDYTPATDEIFKSCMTRLHKTYTFEIRNGSRCFDVFTVDNYYMQEYICYRINWETATNVTYSYRNLAYALTYPGMFFGVRFDLDTFEAADNIKAIVHKSGDFPFKSSAYAPSFSRNYEPEKKKAKYNYFQLAYALVSIRRLPAPYTTNCRDYNASGFASINDCIKECLVAKTLSMFDKLPFTTIATEKSDKKHINGADIANLTFSKILNDLENGCGSNCKHLDCIEQYSLTSVLKEEVGEDDSVLSFIVYVPRDPTFNITYHPKLTLTEYLIYVFSCFGTWFGLSAMNVNPFQADFYRKWRKAKPGETDASSSTNNVNSFNTANALRHGGKPRTLCHYCMATRLRLRQEMQEEVALLLLLITKPSVKYAGKWPSEQDNYSHHYYNPLK